MFVNEVTHWWFVAKRFFVTSFINKIGSDKKSKILDLGCGTGAMTEMLAKFGQVLGVEQNSAAIKFLKYKKIPHLQSSINHIGLESNSFDLVTIFDVLYHKRVDENAVLKEAHRLLKNDRHLLITDCALPFFWSLHDERMMAKKRFEKSELEDLLINNDFEIVHSTYTYFFTFPLFVLQRLFFKIFRPKKIQIVAKINPIANTLLLFLTKIDLLFVANNISLPIGSSIMILARKK